MSEVVHKGVHATEPYDFLPSFCGIRDTARPGHGTVNKRWSKVTCKKCLYLRGKKKARPRPKPSEPPPFVPKDPNDRYLIECLDGSVEGKHRLWWMAKRWGYSHNVDSAGRYSRKEAVEICASRRGVQGDRFWSEADVLAGKAGAIHRTVVA